MRGRWSPVLAAAFLVAASACSPQCGAKATPVAHPAAATESTPSAAPSPTAPLQIAAATFHAGEVGASYIAVPLSASGGAQPYTWSVASGTLPDGVILGPDGSVSGSPTSAGKFSFTIQVADSAGGTAALPGSITVAGALSAGLIPACARACQVEAGCVDVCGSFGTVSGGTPPYTYSANGYIPPTTHLNGLTYAGTFTRPVSYWQSTVTLTDSFGETASLSPIFNVYSHISMSGTYLCQGSFVNACAIKVQYSGGTPGGTPTVSVAGVGTWCPSAFTTCPPPAGAPGGFKALAGGGFVTVTVPADCGGACPNGYTAAVSIRLTDQSPCGTGTNCSSGLAVIDVYMVAG